MMTDLSASARVVVITGAASGIGFATAELFRDLGDTVFGLDIVVTYGAGAGFGVAIHRRNSETAVCSGHLSADQVTLDAAGELYGAELNRAIDILHGRRTA